MQTLISFVAFCLLNLTLPTGTKHSVENDVTKHKTDYDSIHSPKAYELFDFADSVIRVHGYKQAVDLLGKHESSYSDPMEKSMFNQVMMTYLSYNSDIKAAQKYEAQLSPKKQLENYSFLKIL